MRIILGRQTRIRIRVKSRDQIRIRIEVKIQKLQRLKLEPCKKMDANNVDNEAQKGSEEGLHTGSHHFDEE
jgi:hypothetical protein